MDFRDQFRKVSDDVGKMARDVADSSKKTTAKARIRRTMHTCNDALQQIYSTIGLKYYMENQCEPDPQFADLFAQVSDLLTQMDALKSELAGLDHAAICPSCGSKVSDTQKFCPECGCKNDSYGKWKAEAEAAEEARRAAKDAEQADRKARKAEKSAQETVYETTAETRSADDVILSAADATACDEEY